MKLEQGFCSGGRYNNRIVTGIKFNGHYIYPNTIYNVYEVEVPPEGTTIYFDGTNRTNSAYIPYYDLGNGDINPVMESKELTVYRSDSDLNSTSYEQNFPTYTYTKAGTYQVRTTEVLYSSYGTSVEKNPIKSVIALRSDLKDASYLFEHCRAIEKFDIGQKETLMDLETTDYMFSLCASLISIDFSGYLFPKLTNMNYMFDGCESMAYANFSNCDLSSVTSCRGMFGGCDSLISVNFSNCDLSSLLDLGDITYYPDYVRNWNFSNCKLSSVLDIKYPAFGVGTVYDSINFSNADLSSLTSLYRGFMSVSANSVDFSNADLSSVTNLKDAFYGPTNGSAIKNLNFSGANLSNLTSMNASFANCKCTELDLSNFNTSKVTDVSSLFSNSTLLESVDIRNFDISDDTDTINMFMGCTALHTIKLNNCNNRTIKNIINSYDFPTGTIDGVTRKIYCKQSNATGLTAPSGWVFEYTDENEVPNMPEYKPPVYTSGMFKGNKSLTEVTKDTIRVTSNNTDLSYMFSGCHSLESVDTTSWETSKVTTMGYMFYYCLSLTEVDVSNFNTSNVTDMYGMFNNCKNLTSLDVSNFDTSNVTTMQGMFYNCAKLTELDVSNFDTSKVTKMGYIFYQCNSLTSLDVSNFDTSKVTDMQNMFAYCDNLISLDISNFDASNVTSMFYMFYGCNKLQELRLDNCNNATINNIIKSYGFPTDVIDGVTRKIYCKEANAAGLTAPTNWVFEFVE